MAGENKYVGQDAIQRVITNTKGLLANKQDTLTFDNAPTANSTNPVKSGGVYTALAGKVDTVSGKGLSTEDYTTEEKTKLSGIASGAEVNVLEAVKSGSTTFTISSKAVDIQGVDNLTNYYTKSQIDATISSVYKPAGSVAFASLPSLSASVLGNIYNVTDAFTTTSDFVEGSGKSYPAGTNVGIVDVGTGGTPSYKYDVFAGFVDLSGYVPTTRKVNNKALSSDISLTASDVGALASNTTYVSSVNGSSGAVTGMQTTSNLVTSFSSTTSDSKYPSEKLVKDSLDAKQATISSSNKLSADLVDDTSATNKFVTSTDISNWNAKQDALTEITTSEIDAMF